MYQSFWFPDLITLSCCAGAGCLGPEGWLHKCEIDTEHFTNANLSVAVSKCFRLGFVVLDIIFMCLVFTASLSYLTRFLTVQYHHRLQCRLKMCVPLSCLWVTWMDGIICGLIIRPRIVMVLQPLTWRLCLVAISWLSSLPMHVVELLTSWWLMFLLSTGFCCSTHWLRRLLLSVSGHFDGVGCSKFVPPSNTLKVFDGMGLAGFTSRANDFLLALAAPSVL